MINKLIYHYNIIKNKFYLEDPTGSLPLNLSEAVNQIFQFLNQVGKYIYVYSCNLEISQWNLYRGMFRFGRRMSSRWRF